MQHAPIITYIFILFSRHSSFSFSDQLAQLQNRDNPPGNLPHCQGRKSVCTDTAPPQACYSYCLQTVTQRLSDAVVHVMAGSHVDHMDGLAQAAAHTTHCTSISRLCNCQEALCPWPPHARRAQQRARARDTSRRRSIRSSSAHRARVDADEGGLRRALGPPRAEAAQWKAGQQTDRLLRGDRSRAGEPPTAASPSGEQRAG